MQRNASRHWPTARLIWLTCFTITAAACAPTIRTLPDWTPPEVENTAEQPMPACAYPDFMEIELNGVEVAALDAKGFTMWLQCLEVADANRIVAEKNAESVQALIEAYQRTVKIGDLQQDLAEFQLNELERDRRSAEFEAWTVKGLLAAVLIAVAL